MALPWEYDASKDDAPKAANEARIGPRHLKAEVQVWVRAKEKPR
jgi:hypothetical protein